MHIKNFVVCIKANNTILREYKSDKNDDTNYRHRKIYIPYDTEYKFLFKNQSYKRKNVEIFIDGSAVGEWIISPNSHVELERFLESNRKFKVVDPLGPNGSEVADPTNKNNGDITIKVWDEKSFFTLSTPYVSSHQPIIPWETTVWCSTDNAMVGNAVNTNLRSYSGKAATVEGSVSDQTFTSTHWNGNDGEPLIFEYKIVGKNDNSEVSKSFESVTYRLNIINDLLKKSVITEKEAELRRKEILAEI